MTKRPPIICRIEQGRFVPVDAWGAEQIDALPRDVEYALSYTRPATATGKRNWYWAGLGLLVENFSDEHRAKWPSARKVHNMLMEAMGYVDRLWRVDGTFRIEVDSVSFDKMDDAEFSELFETARSIVAPLFGYDPWSKWMDARPPKGGRP